MDNASKALIMAGAILISVAIVGIGIYIFSTASGLATRSVDDIGAMDVQTFNSRFYAYAVESASGEVINGTQARALESYAKSILGADGVTGSVSNTRSKYKITYEHDANDTSSYINHVNIDQVQ